MQPAMASPALTEGKQAATSRPYITNWFFSLRRQPRKHKKTAAANIATQTGEGPLQRSCIDLSATNSVFYLTSPLDLPTPAKDFAELGSASTDNIYEDDLAARKRGRAMTQLCAPCCCPGKATLHSPTNMILKEESSLKDTASSKYSMLEETPVINPPTPSNLVTVLSQHSEFLRTTTVTTTRTLIITRPVEVLLNDKGEIMARRSVSRARRSNSLGCMLDEYVETEGMNGEQGTAVNANGALDALRPGVLASCDDLQFIDDNNATHTNHLNNLYMPSHKSAVNHVELRNQHAVIMRHNNKV